MTIISAPHNTGIKFVLRCKCGWQTEPHFTLEAAGRAADLHMAERFPLPSSRKPCGPPLEYTGI